MPTDKISSEALLRADEEGDEGSVNGSIGKCALAILMRICERRS